MESGVIPVGVLQPDLLWWYMNEGSSHCSWIHGDFCPKSHTLLLVLQHPDWEAGRMIPGGPEQPHTVLLHYLLSVVTAAHPWNLHCAPNPNPLSFTEVLGTQVSPVWAQVQYPALPQWFCQGLPTPVKAKRGVPWSYGVFFSTFGMEFLSPLY